MTKIVTFIAGLIVLAASSPTLQAAEMENMIYLELEQGRV